MDGTKKCRREEKRDGIKYYTVVSPKKKFLAGYWLKIAFLSTTKWYTGVVPLLWIKLCV